MAKCWRKSLTDCGEHGRGKVERPGEFPLPHRTVGGFHHDRLPYFSVHFGNVIFANEHLQTEVPPYRVTNSLRRSDAARTKTFDPTRLDLSGHGMT